MFPGRKVMLAPNLARLRPPAPLGASTRPARGMSGFKIRKEFDRIIYASILGVRAVSLGFFIVHVLHKKGFTEINRRRYTSQNPATKSARGPDDKP